MYYRYEGRRNPDNVKPWQTVYDGDFEWTGIFTSGALDPDQRRRWNKFLRVPKWYRDNKDASSKCWFTEEGYNKYHSIMDDMIDEISDYWEVRLITKEELENVVMRGKIQCIELLEEQIGV